MVLAKKPTKKPTKHEHMMPGMPMKGKGMMKLREMVMGKEMDKKKGKKK